MMYRLPHAVAASSRAADDQTAATSALSTDVHYSKTGQTLILPLLGAREFHEFTFVFNGAIEKPVHDPERQAGTEFGVAFGRD